jgi:hypothetical protein
MSRQWYNGDASTALAAQMIKLHSLQIGKIAPLGPDQVPSGYVKRPAGGRVQVDAAGLTGDEIADLSVHGGPEKAVYGYALAHYISWRGEHPEHTDRFAPGAFGENLTIESLTEADICLGDVHRIGTVLLRVSQPSPDSHASNSPFSSETSACRRSTGTINDDQLRRLGPVDPENHKLRISRPSVPVGMPRTAPQRGDGQLRRALERLFRDRVEGRPEDRVQGQHGCSKLPHSSPSGRALTRWAGQRLVRNASSAS